MDLILFMIVVLVLLALALWAVRAAPIPSPFNWLIQLLCVVLALVFIASRAGFI